MLMAGLLLVFYIDGFLIGAPLTLLLAFACLGVVALVGFLHHADHGDLGQIAASTPLLSALSAFAVAVLSRGLLLPLVFNVAAVGSAGGLAEKLGRSRCTGVGAAVYCGAFVGMTSEQVLDHPGWIVIAGALAGVLLEWLQTAWSGIGGKLGSTAFLAVFSVVGLTTLLNLQGPGAHLHRFTHAEQGLVFLLALLSSQFTHHLSYRNGIGAVLGSALPSMVAGWLLPVHLAVVWLGASFVGMTSPSRLTSHPTLQLLVMGALYATFSLGFEPTLAGLGGDLGATAAISVFAVLGLSRLLTWTLVFWRNTKAHGG